MKAMLRGILCVAATMALSTPALAWIETFDGFTPGVGVVGGGWAGFNNGDFFPAAVDVTAGGLGFSGGATDKAAVLPGGEGAAGRKHTNILAGLVVPNSTLILYADVKNPNGQVAQLFIAGDTDLTDGNAPTNQIRFNARGNSGSSFWTSHTGGASDSATVGGLTSPSGGWGSMKIEVDLNGSAVVTAARVYVNNIQEGTVSFNGTPLWTPTQVGFILDSTSDNAKYMDNFTVTVVPEPSVMALMGLGGLAMLRRRR